MPAELPLTEIRHSSWTITHGVIRQQTAGPSQFIDVTDRVLEQVQRSGILDGLVTVQTRHTTTAVVVNEAEPLLLEDLQDALERWAPAGATYRHDDLGMRTVNLAPGESANGQAHARAVLLGASETLTVVDGAIQLGRWQRIFLVELDGPRRRHLSVTVMGRTER